MSGGIQIHNKDQLFQQLYRLDDPDSEPDEGLEASVKKLRSCQSSAHGERLTSSRHLQRTVSAPAPRLTLGRDTLNGNLPDSLRDPPLHKGSLIGTMKKRATTFEHHGLDDSKTNRRFRAPPNPPAAPRRLFTGLHFFYFPNSDVHPVRKLRIRKAIEHGAVWEKQWSPKVTHVIVDQGMEFQQLLNYINAQKLPEGVILANENYPAMCLTNQFMISPDEPHFRVNGAPGKPIPIEGPTGTSANTEQSDTSLKLKPAAPAVIARQPDTPTEPSPPQQEQQIQQPIEARSENRQGKVESSPTLQDDMPTRSHDDDELDRIIQEAKKLQHMVSSISYQREVWC